MSCGFLKFAISRGLMMAALENNTGSPCLAELKDLSRRRERLVDQMTSLKNDI
jgi:hypothetical protein